MISSCLSKLIKKTVIYLRKLCSQDNYFNFKSNEDNFFIKHIKFERRKELKENDQCRLNANGVAS